MTATTTVKQFRGKCKQCGDKIAPAATAQQFNRNRGVHMRFRHGVISPHNQKARKRADVRFSQVNGTSTVSVAPTKKLGRPRKFAQRVQDWQGLEVAPVPRALTLNRPAKELRRVAHLFFRAAKLRRRLEKVLSPYV